MRDTSVVRLDDGRRLCSVHTRLTQSAPQPQTTCSCSRSVAIIGIVSGRQIRQSEGTKSHLSQAGREGVSDHLGKVKGLWERDRAVQFSCSAAANAEPFEADAQNPRQREKFGPLRKIFHVSGSDLEYIDDGKMENGVLPILMASAFHILGKSSSFRRGAPDAQSMTSGSLPGKVPNPRTQLSHT